MPYRFGAFELEVERIELRKSGDVVPVEPQVFALVAQLVASRDRVVSKDEIHKRIWNDRIVSEAALNSRIRSVRRAVDDDGSAQRVIRTVRGNGFRFVADVTRNTAAKSLFSTSISARLTRTMDGRCRGTSAKESPSRIRSQWRSAWT
jgi:DNA-binding winged helix-turn-helix (wHTH) protein